jgi:hypothetical protein
MLVKFRCPASATKAVKRSKPYHRVETGRAQNVWPKFDIVQDLHVDTSPVRESRCMFPALSCIIAIINKPTIHSNQFGTTKCWINHYFPLTSSTYDILLRHS